MVLLVDRRRIYRSIIIGLGDVVTDCKIAMGYVPPMPPPPTDSLVRTLEAIIGRVSAVGMTDVAHTINVARTDLHHANSELQQTRSQATGIGCLMEKMRSQIFLAKLIIACSLILVVAFAFARFLGR